MKKSTHSSPQYKNQHPIELNDILEPDDIQKLSKLLFTLYDSINTNTNEFTLTREQNNLLTSLDENVTPNFKNFKIAINEISTNNSLDINAKKQVLNYHVFLTGLYVMRDIIEREYQLFETYPTTLSLSSSTQNSLVNLNTQKHQLSQALNINDVPELPNSITPETVNKYLKKLVDFDKALSVETSVSVKHNLVDRLPRSLESFFIENDIKITATHGVQKAKSIMLHDFGNNYFVKNTIDEQATDNLELLLEAVADKISSVSFPRTIAQVKNIGEIESPLRRPEAELFNKITEKISGVRSKMIPGVEFYKYKNDPREIENFEEFISKSLVLLDPDCHARNGFVHNKRLTKIDHGRLGWLNFKNINQLKEFIKDRFTNDDFWKKIPFNQEKLIKAMVNDLDKIDKSLLDDGSKIDKSNLKWVAEQNSNRNIIGTSFNEVSRKFNIYPTEISRIDNMKDYIGGKWRAKDAIATPAELTAFFTKRFEQQHNLQRAYVIDQAIKLNLKLEGLDPIIYIRQPGKELFLKAYNTLLLKPGGKPLVTQKTIPEREITSPEIRGAIFTADGHLKPIPKNAQDKINNTFNIAKQLGEIFHQGPSDNPKKIRTSNEYFSKKTSPKKVNNRGGHAR